MHILFTGATSFTGMWFVRTLTEQGHTVIAAMRGSRGNYNSADLRSTRIDQIEHKCELIFDAAFGSQRFFDLLNESPRFDVLCHHASDATNYKSQDFNALNATSANCGDLPQVLSALGRSGCRKIVLTGSVFETQEGAGTFPLRAFSPYGLSKSLTSAMFEYYAHREGMSLGKFVIANPFGPYEQPRFTDYLLRCWRGRKVAQVNTPDYVRDNIHISLLALSYADFVAALPADGFSKINPSFYVESQGAFAIRFAREIGARLALDTPLELMRQRDFSEPFTRINTDRIAIDSNRWQEVSAWDNAADYYRKKIGAFQ